MAMGIRMQAPNQPQFPETQKRIRNNATRERYSCKTSFRPALLNLSQVREMIFLSMKHFFPVYAFTSKRATMI